MRIIPPSPAPRPKGFSDLYICGYDSNLFSLEIHQEHLFALKMKGSLKKKKKESLNFLCNMSQLYFFTSYKSSAETESLSYLL